MSTLHLRSAFAILSALLVLVACSGPGTDTPLAPGNVTATEGPGYVVVAWTDRSDDETGFAVYRSAVSSSGIEAQQATPIGTVAADETSFLDHDAELSTSYRYSVATLDADGLPGAESAAASDVVIEPGVDLVVGTLNGATRTDVLLYVYFPQEDVKAEDVTLELTGPDGWNDDEVHTMSLAQFLFDYGWGTFYVGGSDAVEGTYRVEVTRGSDTFVAEATLDDATFAFPKPSGLTGTEAGDAGVSVEWNVVPGAASYRVGVVATSPQETLAYTFTLATEHTFENIDLPDPQDGRDVFVYVYAYQVDQRDVAIEPPIPPDPYGSSYRARWLSFAP